MAKNLWGHLLGHGAAGGLLVGPVVDFDVLAPALPDHDRGVQILLEVKMGGGHH